MCIAVFAIKIVTKIVKHDLYFLPKIWTNGEKQYAVVLSIRITPPPAAVLMTTTTNQFFDIVAHNSKSYLVCSGQTCLGF